MPVRRAIRVWMLSGAAVALLLLAASHAQAARLSEEHICKVHHCTTVAASATVRVFEANEREPKCCGALDYRADFALWLPTGKVTEIANGSNHGFGRSPYVEEAKIAGDYVAYSINGLVEDRYDAPELPEKVNRVNARTGQRTTDPTVRVGCEGHNLDFAVNARGTVAWSYGDLCFSGEGTSVMYGSNSGEATVDMVPGNSTTTIMLAHGPTVNQGSLALVPGHLYWLQAGIPHTFAAP